MREIIYTREFDDAVELIGGYRLFDKAIEAIVDALYNNPYGFEKIENDHVSFRYAITKPFLDVPALVLTFSIDEKHNVVIDHVEEYFAY